MSPQAGHEVYLEEIETEVLSVFIKRKILNDRHIAVVLTQLAEKLEAGKGEDK